MAGLCWMAVVLTVFLSAGNSLAAVDQNWLASIIEGIRNQYGLGDTFSLAVNVPENEDPNNLQQVLQDDPADGVKQAVSSGQVYQGTRVVAAQSGQLSQVLEKIEPFIKSSDGNVLVIYSTESPTNANGDDITGKIDSIIQNWKGYAFVFSNVANVPGTDPSQLAESFKQLGISKFGLDNIFRCYKPGDDPFQCTSCSSGGGVAPLCVANSGPSNQEQGQGEESTAPSTGTDTGVETGPGGELATNLGQEIVGGMGGQRGEGQGGQMSKCKGRGRRKGGCKRRGGRGRGKKRKVRKGRKQRRRGKGRGKGKRRGRGGKGKRGGKRRGRGKRRGGRRGKGRKGGKRGGRRKKFRGLE